MENFKAKTKSNKVKTKKKFKPIYIIPIVFVICCLLFAFYIYSAEQGLMDRVWE